MKEIFSDPVVISAITSVITAACAAAVAIFQTIKAKQSVKKAKAYLEAENAKLQSELLRAKSLDYADKIVAAYKEVLDEKTATPCE